MRNPCRYSFPHAAQSITETQLGLYWGRQQFQRGAALSASSQLLGAVAERLHPWDGERCVVETITAAAAFQVGRKANRD